MAWQDEMVPTLRYMLGDFSATNPTYIDDTLEQTILVAARQVTSALIFDQVFVTSMQNGTLTPDPTIGDNKNEAFINLVTLKAACILDRTEASLAARRAIIVKDGSSAIDLSRVAQNKIALIEKGWCAVYEDAQWDYQYRRTQGVAGAAVMGPIRLFAWESFGTAAFGQGDARSRGNLFN